MASSSDHALVCNRTTTSPHRRWTRISGADDPHHHRLHPDPALRSTHEEDPPPITFFYEGRVHVFHGISRRQARALALLLSDHVPRDTNHSIMEAMSPISVQGNNTEAIAGGQAIREEVLTTNLHAIEERMGDNGGINASQAARNGFDQFRDGDYAANAQRREGRGTKRGGPEERGGYGGGYVVSGRPEAYDEQGRRRQGGGVLSCRRASLARFLKSRWNKAKPFFEEDKNHVI